MSSSKLSALPPFTENNPPLANSAMEIILKGINRVNPVRDFFFIVSNGVNCKKAVIIVLTIVRKIPSVVLIQLTEQNFFSKKDEKIEVFNVFPNRGFPPCLSRLGRATTGGVPKEFS